MEPAATAISIRSTGNARKSSVAMTPILLPYWRWCSLQMDSPHINAEITCLLFQPKAHRIVLTGASDGSLKCWERSKRQSAKDVNRMVTGWTCSYSLTHRYLIGLSIIWSHESSENLVCIQRSSHHGHELLLRWIGPGSGSRQHGVHLGPCQVRSR